MGILPEAQRTFEGLPEAERARQEAMQDVFGMQLFDLRTAVMNQLEELVEVPEKRLPLGTIRSSPYDAVAAMADADRRSAITLARAAIHLFIQYLLAMLDDEGVQMKMGESHFLHYKLLVQVLRVSDGDAVEEHALNHSPLPTLGGRYRKWLSRAEGRENV